MGESSPKDSPANTRLYIVSGFLHSVAHANRKAGVNDSKTGGKRKGNNTKTANMKL